MTETLVVAARRLVAIEKRLTQMAEGMFTEAEQETYVTELAAALHEVEQALGETVEPVSLIEIESRKPR